MRKEDSSVSRRILKVDKVWPTEEETRKDVEKLRKDRTKDLKMKITVTTDDNDSKSSRASTKTVRKPVMDDPGWKPLLSSDELDMLEKQEKEQADDEINTGKSKKGKEGK